jgi:hypothetical protein
MKYSTNSTICVKLPTQPPQCKESQIPDSPHAVIQHLTCCITALLTSLYYFTYFTYFTYFIWTNRPCCITALQHVENLSTSIFTTAWYFSTRPFKFSNLRHAATMNNFSRGLLSSLLPPSPPSKKMSNYIQFVLLLAVS